MQEASVIHKLFFIAITLFLAHPISLTVKLWRCREMTKGHGCNLLNSTSLSGCMPKTAILNSTGHFTRRGKWVLVRWVQKMIREKLSLKADVHLFAKVDVWLLSTSKETIFQLLFKLKWQTSAYLFDHWLPTHILLQFNGLISWKCILALSLRCKIKAVQVWNYLPHFSTRWPHSFSGK